MEQRALDRMEARANELKREHHMSLRDEIAMFIEREYDDRPFKYQAADAILALLRERLLSDAVVGAASDAIESQIHFTRDDWHDEARAALTAALDAITENTNATT
jgi:hypothetical protein